MPSDASQSAYPKAEVRSLVRAFWSTSGWRQPPELPTGAELERAIVARVLFEEPKVEKGHDECVHAALVAAAATPLAAVADGFLASLGTRRLDIRSALGSFAVARHLIAHDFEPRHGTHRCAVCGLGRADRADYNVYSFERHKWGGVRRDDLSYVAFDLEQFAHTTPVASDATDRQIARNLLAALDTAGASSTVPSLAGSLTMLKGNREERRTVLQILAICGVLPSPGHPSYREQFVHAATRELPHRHFVDDPYPACWWKGANGVDRAAVREFLPQLDPV